MSTQGQLICVGTGMMLGAHMTPISLSYIQNADVVFALMSHGVVEKWLESLHADVRSLQPYYAPGQDRNTSYLAMREALLAEVRLGKKVVGAFYGHPGIFASVPHQAIAQAKAEGFHALMEPGISAQDCLYADLAIDPGRFGCQHYETTQLMMFERQIDPSAYLILWQVGVAGDSSAARLGTTEAGLVSLVTLLTQWYPLDHQVILYEACTLPVGKARMETILLSELPRAKLFLFTTLVIPPSQKLKPNLQFQMDLGLV